MLATQSLAACNRRRRGPVANHASGVRCGNTSTDELECHQFASSTIIHGKTWRAIKQQRSHARARHASQAPHPMSPGMPLPPVAIYHTRAATSRGGGVYYITKRTMGGSVERDCVSAVVELFGEPPHRLGDCSPSRKQPLAHIG